MDVVAIPGIVSEAITVVRTSSAGENEDAEVEGRTGIAAGGHQGSITFYPHS